MPSLNDVATRALRALLGNRTFSRHQLQINAASSQTVKTTSAIIYSIDGLTYQKTALAAQAITSISTQDQLNATGYATHRTQPVSTTVYYALCLDSSGNVTCVQGNYSGQAVTNADTGMKLVGTGTVPEIGDTRVVFGLIKIVTNGATQFIVGTTALDAAGLTVTFMDVAVLPSDTTP